jgi:phage-related protein
MLREIIFYENYFTDFFFDLPEDVKLKFRYVFKLIETQERVSVKFLKHIEGSKGLFEVRVMVGNNIYRVFCCFDGNNLVVLFNGFQKKDQKTPKSEIVKAEKLKKEYFENK